MQSFNTSRMGSLLRKFLEQARALEFMPSGMVRHLLRADEVGQLSCEDLGGGDAVVRRPKDVRCMEG
jgi:hypothetical protein